MPNPAKFVITVHEVRGECSYKYQKGDQFEFTGLKTIEGFCGAAYHAMFPVIFALNFNASSPFAKEKDTMYTTCPDDGKIVFQIRKVE